ncbi:MAG: hypothetical protein MK105_15755 [Crocinitomicaceae bacterium]|nr:hypothetical protein [Crocinitomicaceae bacterium]
MSQPLSLIIALLLSICSYSQSSELYSKVTSDSSTLVFSIQMHKIETECLSSAHDIVRIRIYNNRSSIRFIPKGDFRNIDAIITKNVERNIKQELIALEREMNNRDCNESEYLINFDGPKGRSLYDTCNSKIIYDWIQSL